MSRPQFKVMSRFRFKSLQGGDNIGRAKWASEMSRLRLSMSRSRFNGTQEGKVRVNAERMSRDRAKGLRPKMSRQGDKLCILSRSC